MNNKLFSVVLAVFAFGVKAEGQMQGGSSMAVQQLQESYEAASQVEATAKSAYDNASGLDKANALKLLNSAKEAAAKAKQALDRARAVASNARTQSAQ